VNSERVADLFPIELKFSVYMNSLAEVTIVFITFFLMRNAYARKHIPSCPIIHASMLCTFHARF
jgi:hypothetical protein